MALKHRTGLALLALFVTADVWAQVIQGYQVGWGIQSVPLSPWASAAIAIMLTFAAYAFLRKRSGRAMMMLAGAALVAGLTLNTQETAFALVGPTDNITTPSGSMTLYCTTSHILGTTVVGGVSLTVTPINGVPATPINGAPAPTAIAQCTSGTHLNPGDICELCPVT